MKRGEFKRVRVNASPAITQAPVLGWPTMAGHAAALAAAPKLISK